VQIIDWRFILERGRPIGVDRYRIPGVDQILNRRVHVVGQRWIGIHTDSIELTPKADFRSLVGRGRIRQLPMIDLPNGRDQIGPVAKILLARQTLHLVADDKGLDATFLRDRGEVNYFRFV